MEPGPKLEQGGQPTTVLDGAGGRLQDPADELEQRRLAGSVRADQSDGAAGSDLQVDVLERPEVILVLIRPTEVDQPFLERLLLADDETLGCPRDLDDGRRRRHRSHHSSWAKLLCKRANARWHSQTRT